MTPVTITRLYALCRNISRACWLARAGGGMTHHLSSRREGNHLSTVIVITVSLPRIERSKIVPRTERRLFATRLAQALEPGGDLTDYASMYRHTSI
jgi:hypothetical protein